MKIWLKQDPSLSASLNIKNSPDASKSWLHSQVAQAQPPAAIFWIVGTHLGRQLYCIVASSFLHPWCYRDRFENTMSDSKMATNK
jgi:hypothetical protein